MLATVAQLVGSYSRTTTQFGDELGRVVAGVTGVGTLLNTGNAEVRLRTPYAGNRQSSEGKAASAQRAEAAFVTSSGHVTGLVNGSGQVTHQYRYNPWGEVESISESETQPLRYMARELDPTTGLYYVRARWYDPVLGRFVSEDPIGLAGGINPYAYVGNSPTNARDPSGLKCTITYKFKYYKDDPFKTPIAGTVQITSVECDGSGGGGGGGRQGDRALDEIEHARLQCVVNNYLFPDARDRFLPVLNGGHSVVGTRPQFPNAAPAQAWTDINANPPIVGFVPGVGGGTIRVNVEYTLAEIVAHEVGHLKQVDRYGGQTMLALMSAPMPYGTIWRAIFEADATRYARENTRTDVSPVCPGGPRK